MNSYSLYSDEQLVKLLKTGDESAFNEIYERYWELLLGLAYNRLKQLHEAEDAVHNVLTSLWTSRATRNITALRSYLAGSLKYHVVRIASRKKLFAAFISEERREAISYTIKPAEDDEILIRIYNEMDKLPEKCRVIFRMSRIEGMSNAEIAATLHITTKTVENQINKAQGRLRLSLKDISPVILLLFLKP